MSEFIVLLGLVGLFVLLLIACYGAVRLVAWAAGWDLR